MTRENLIFFILLLLPLLSYAHIKSELKSQLASDPKGFNGPYMSVEKTINHQVTELAEIDLLTFLDLHSWEGQKVKKIIIKARGNNELGSNAYIVSNKFAISPVKEISVADSRIEFSFNKDIIISEKLNGLKLVLQGSSFISEITAELQAPHLLEQWYL